MITFEIRDSSQVLRNNSDRILGFLFYFERHKRFYAELLSGVDEWDAPFMFKPFVEKKIFSIDHIWSKKWVELRIIPRERQNIGDILRDNGLKEYDEYRLLVLSEGRCAQDDCYVRKVKEKGDLPDEIIERLSKKVLDVMPLSNNRAIAFFRNGSSKTVSFNELAGDDRLFKKILSDEDVFMRMKVSPGGNGIEWDEDHFISAGRLYRVGKKADIAYEDILRFVDHRIMDTSEVSDELKVSRQYIHQLVSEGALKPLKARAKERSFQRALIESE